MKKILTLAIAAVIACSASAQTSLESLLGKLKGASGQKEETTQQDNGSGEGSLLDKLTGLGNALGIIPSKSVDVAYLQGVWDYQKPAVSFKSDNFLAKAGGVAASAKIEGKIAPYYQKAGLDKMKLTVMPDSTFTMQLKRGKLQGTITTTGEKDAQALIFNFKAFGKLSIGSMEAYVNAESGSVMSITFDVSKLITLVQKVAAFSGNSSLKSLSSLLDNYEGVTAGFKMKKTGEAPATTGNKD